MAEEAEISTIDLRYESYRMKNPALETKLLALIAERGIEEPLEGVDGPGERILLNGFKRYRCARKLGLGLVPYRTLGEDEASGILAVLRSSNKRTLSILEEARFIDELKSFHQLTVADIAELLSRSKAWVSMRLGLIAQMSERIRKKILDGAFPLYSYMYTLRPFMRLNSSEGCRSVDEFVEAVGGNRLSVREIEQLAHGYFGGLESFREEIRSGKFFLVLERMKQVPENPRGCNEFERALLKDLGLVQDVMRRVAIKHSNRRLQSRTFHAEANLLSAGVLSRIPAFKKALEELYDRTATASGDIPSAPGGDGRAQDKP